MKTTFRTLLALCIFVTLMTVTPALAQTKKNAKKQPAQTTSEAKKADTTTPAEGGKAAETSAGKKEPTAEGEKKEEKKEEEDEEKQFKESASVKWLASKLGIESPTTAYWGSTWLNFLVIAILFFALLKSNLPKAFRDRTDAIRKGMEEAKKASAEAKTRLSGIEERLAKLDAEIADMQAKTEKDIRTEEDRLKLAAGEEARRIEESVKQELATATTLARRELKQFAAELAVGLAEKKIKVTDVQDRALVNDFSSRMDSGKGGN